MYGTIARALDSRRVVEVVPTLTLKKQHSAREYLPGLFNYRGHLVPIVDPSQMIEERRPALTWG